MVFPFFSQSLAHAHDLPKLPPLPSASSACKLMLPDSLSFTLLSRMHAKLSLSLLPLLSPSIILPLYSLLPLFTQYPSSFPISISLLFMRPLLAERERSRGVATMVEEEVTSDLRALTTTHRGEGRNWLDAAVRAQAMAEEHKRTG